MIADIQIRPLTTIEDYRSCERVQQAVWETAPIETTPADVMITVHRHGGLALGAYLNTGEMVGCLFGFLGRPSADNPIISSSGRWQFCCHFVGIVPEWRGRGIGNSLLMTMKSWALENDLDLITWTYDPLEAVNAVFYIGRLGVVCQCYLRDLYGEMRDSLNSRLPSDRFEVAWFIKQEHVRHRLARDRRILDLGESHDVRSISTGPSTVFTSKDKLLLIELPDDIQKIKLENLDVALQWRLSLRESCENAFAAGFVIRDIACGSIDETGKRRLFYVLEKTAQIRTNYDIDPMGDLAK